MARYGGVRMIESETQLCGLIGHPVEHSISPIMHNALFEHFKINAQYIAFDVTDLKNAVRGLKGLNFIGANVTSPHKVTVMKYLDKIEVNAGNIGAVNTIVVDDGKLVGYNTDYIGIIKTLEDKTLIKGSNVIVLGAGGAARAAVYAMQQRQAGSITILNRTFSKAKKLGKRFKCHYGELYNFKISKPDIIINTTNLGMGENKGKSPIDTTLLNNVVVLDAIYNPLKTKLIRDANKKGCTAINGIPWLIHQGLESFRLWTGKTPEYNFMENVVFKHLKQKK